MDSLDCLIALSENILNKQKARIYRPCLLLPDRCMPAGRFYMLEYSNVAARPFRKTMDLTFPL